MILAETADAATTGLSPLAIVIISATGGAIVTALFALLGARLNAQREDRRWEREHRYDAFIRAAAIAERFRDAREAGEALKADVAATGPSPALTKRFEESQTALNAILSEMYDVVAALEMLGPNDVLIAFNDYTNTFPAGDVEATQAASLKFINAARRATSIKD